MCVSVCECVSHFWLVCIETVIVSSLLQTPINATCTACRVATSEEECAAIAEERGLSLGTEEKSFVGDHFGEVGCFAFSGGQDFVNTAFWGTGGSESSNVAPLLTPWGGGKYRPHWCVRNSTGKCLKCTIHATLYFNSSLPSCPPPLSHTFPIRSRGSWAGRGR